MPEKYHWEVLADFTRQHNFIKGVEIGVRWGGTSRYLLQNCPNLHMWGVDLMRPMPENKGPGQETYMSWPWGKYRDGVAYISKEFPERFKMMVMDTVAASKLFEDEFFDFVFIDADHSYPGVFDDIVSWVPKVKLGGLITGHDINLESVRNAVADTIGNYTTEGERWNNIWWAQKTIKNSDLTKKES